MLTVAQDRLQTLATRRGKNVSIHLFGQEVQPETYAICKADMLLKGDGEQVEHIVYGSTLSADGNATRQFDFMLANPPYGKSWKVDAEKMGGKKEILDTRFNTYLEDGTEMKMIPRTSDGQLLFLLNNVAKMKKDSPLGSRIAEVHNGSSIFTGDAGSGESNARRYMIENDLVEAIIALPENMFYNTGIGTFIWVLSNKKEERRKGKIQLIDARLSSNFLSYSAPTSMGKSFIMHMFIKEQIMNGVKMNFARIVPTKALINEMRNDTINDLKNILEEQNYRVVTAASDISLEEEHNFILIMTPERLLYFLISNPDFQLDYLFIDEAHKIGGRNSRGPFYYKVVDLLSRKKQVPHFIFASPNIPNPEEYLKLVTEAEKGAENAITSSYAPVTQFKFIINCEDQTISIYNDHTKTPVFVCKIKRSGTELMSYMLLMEQYDPEHKQRTLAYVNSKNSAIENARLFADRRAPLNDPELKRLASDIKREVHGDYFLSDIVEKGVAYHIGYLPSSIRSRIEELFKDGKITTMFCTSTLIEGVNLPADNLFIANNYNGRPKMSGVEFKNLIGRVGRIKFNLYGNVFFVTDGKRTTEKEYLELLREPVKEQKLSVVQDLKPKLKKHIVEALLEGDAVIDKYNDSQPEEEYIMMRKFGLILLQDIVDERDSLVKREFSKQLSNDDLLKIKNLYDNSKNYIDNDINISVDQTKKLAKAIREGSHFPEAENGYFSHKMVYKFLDELRQIFDWDRYEYSTLGKKDKDGEYRMLSWYAVILSQWMEGHGLNNIMRKALTFRRENPYAEEYIVYADGETSEIKLKKNLLECSNNTVRTDAESII